MKMKLLVHLLVAVFLATTSRDARAAQLDRIGVIHLGGVFSTVVDGLRAGLKEQGLEEGKQFSLDVRDLKGDAKAVARAAQALEQIKVKLIFTVATPATSGVMEATRNTPIVFAIGADPVAQKYVTSFAQPGGRLTGGQYLAVDLVGKRLEILKEIIPKLRSIVTFYNPGTAVSIDGAKIARDEAQRRNLKLIEREVKTVDVFYNDLNSLKTGEYDAYLYVADPMIASHAERIVDVARAKKLPTMFHDRVLVERGGLASYGQSYFEIGRRAAKYIRQVLGGASPSNLRVETMDDVELTFNLETAKKIGVRIPPNVLARAAKVIK
jgi:putative ABC transport system substrate-binding protein